MNPIETVEQKNTALRKLSQVVMSQPDLGRSILYIEKIGEEYGISTQAAIGSILSQRLNIKSSLAVIGLTACGSGLKATTMASAKASKLQTLAVQRNIFTKIVESRFPKIQCPLLLSMIYIPISC